ncbi:MAG: DUF2946 domain-containing protein [Burkholderiaceae bacterium]|nr:DUF2946 domain-containing protein [Burkholderiaceae bacterium]
MNRQGSLYRQLAGWALCALTFAALAPTLSGWFAANSNTVWSEVCSATGTRRVAFDLGPSKAPATSQPGKHCQYCQLLTKLPVLPGAPAALFLLATGTATAIAALSERPAAALLIRSAHRTRGPPGSR